MNMSDPNRNFVLKQQTVSTKLQQNLVPRPNKTMNVAVRPET